MFPSGQRTVEPTEASLPSRNPSQGVGRFYIENRLKGPCGVMSKREVYH